jgi:hypothetical protein
MSSEDDELLDLADAALVEPEDDGPVRRVLVPLSYSRRNPDALRVMRELRRRGVPPRQRSAMIWRWAAGYLDGEVEEAESTGNTSLGMSREQLDALLDGF